MAAQELLSKALPILAASAVAVVSAFGILKAVEAGKSRGASTIVEEFERKKEVITDDIRKDSEVLQQKVTEMFESLEKDIQTFLATWNEKDVRANPEKAQKILDELAKTGFPGAEKIKQTSDWLGTDFLLPVIMFLGDEAKKLLPPSVTAQAADPELVST